MKNDSIASSFLNLTAKYFNTLEELNCDLVNKKPHPDQHLPALLAKHSVNSLLSDLYSLTPSVANNFTSSYANIDYLGYTLGCSLDKSLSRRISRSLLLFAINNIPQIDEHTSEYSMREWFIPGSYLVCKNLTLFQYLENIGIVSSLGFARRYPVTSELDLSISLRYQSGYPDTVDWHFDTMLPSAKAFLSLCPITYEQGPFEIIPSSHKINFQKLQRKEGISWGHFDSKRIAVDFPNTYKFITDSIGDWIVFDNRAIHRQMPPLSRYSRPRLVVHIFAQRKDLSQRLSYLKQVL